ncbi:HAMP domain-containing sensor histidine kinase [Candidatus Accumulibacter sp. ACC005]|uniref:sensor histidine kinase n=1 Tax=Candidatus Accumulibacter sp. ACC005 TaxID=2823331 RepID=UPI0025BD6546|nr:HAMP domain-containing sensor histidine kinase [Candidatus Accumulibacter sp. ACC005]
MKPLAWLASFRLRILFRTSFLLLALAVVAMAVAVLQEEKQRSYDNYQTSFAKTKEQIVARLRHPAGQLALLNPPRGDGPVTPLRPVMLPFSAIDFDDQGKVRHAVEMAGCLVQYKNYGSLCVAIANNPWAGGFIYAAGTFVSSKLVPHRIGNEFLDGAHRLRVVVSLRGDTYRWIAPFEVPSHERRRSSGMRGRFTGYVELDDPDYTGEMPVKEFRGWVWQSGRCLDATKESDEDCEKKSFFSLRLPIEALRDALFQPEKPQWPPPDLDQFEVQVEVLPPGDGPAVFDSNEDGAIPPFSLNDLTGLLLPGETLTIQKADRGEPTNLVQLHGKDEVLEEPSPLLTRLIRKLPVERYDAPVELTDEVVTPMGSYQILFHGDARSVNKILSAVASRVSWFVGAMLLAIALAWLVIETGVVRRISRLTRRSSELSRSVKAIGGLQRFDLADLRGSDELGILANCLNDLLRRVKEDAERERIRAEQERDMWHAVGHEIMSPLQSLMVLHGHADDPSCRYINRMQQAVRVLYGNASPSEAFQSSALQVQAIDIAKLLRNVADNAGFVDVRCAAAYQPVWVRADEFPLEDVFSHILKNADRYRQPGTPITLTLESTETTATVIIHNVGQPIAEDFLDKIFEYGVSEHAEAGANGNRGQGLFVAKTYMAKMGGTITVRNVDDGVSFLLTLQRMRVGGTQ